MCCNATGPISIPILVIGHAAQPVPFNHVGKPDQNQIWYTHQENSWMDAGQCQHWCDSVVVPTVFVLIWDNGSGHNLVNQHPGIEILSAAQRHIVLFSASGWQQHCQCQTVIQVQQYGAGN
jgi:hypothetical protein